MAARGVFDDSIFPGSAYLANIQYNSISQASGSIAANLVSGYMENILATSGATALTTPTAAQIYANLASVLQVSVPQGGPGIATTQNSIVGMSFFVRIINNNAGTLTLSGGTGVTINGTATLATTTARDFAVTITSPTTATMQNIGSGTN